MINIDDFREEYEAALAETEKAAPVRAPRPRFLDAGPALIVGGALVGAFAAPRAVAGAFRDR
ncbi:MAG: hypothetical protein DI629_19945 [Mesorhizobium amorphae]|nr:MAG: hypothetical protein DI629_19945 [Mesorhizobium amorphae]